MFMLSYSYNSTRAYAQSKLANILHAKEMARQLKVENQSSISLYMYQVFFSCFHLQKKRA